MTCSPYPWRIKQLCFHWETSAKWRQTSCLRVPRRHGSRGGKVWTMEPWRWDKWQWRPIKKGVYVHILKYTAIYVVFSLWFDTLSSFCLSSLRPPLWWCGWVESETVVAKTPGVKSRRRVYSPLLPCYGGLEALRESAMRLCRARHHHDLVHNEKVDGAANIALDSHFARPWLQKAAAPSFFSRLTWSIYPRSGSAIWMTSLLLSAESVILFRFFHCTSSFCVNWHWNMLFILVYISLPPPIHAY